MKNKAHKKKKNEVPQGSTEAKGRFESFVNNRLFGFLYDNNKRFGEWLSKVLYPLVSKKNSQYIFSLVCAFLLCVSCYFVENQPYALADKSLLFYYLEKPFRPSISEQDFNVQFVNVGHDRQLVICQPA